MFLFALCLLGGPQYGAAATPRALVLDYEMNPPVVLAGLLEDLQRTGFHPVYRQYYPRVTLDDLNASDLLVILSGDGPGFPGAGMSASAVEPLQAYVRRGGALVLGPLAASGDSKGGDHERYLFNVLLHGLGIPIGIRDDWVVDEENTYAAPLYRGAFAIPSDGHRVTQGLGDRMVTDRSTSLEVGPGAEVLVRSFHTAFPRGERSRTGSYPLVALGRSGKGLVAVASRYVLTWGGGNGKEPAQPMLPLPKEEQALKSLRRNLLAYIHDTLNAPGHPQEMPPQNIPLPPPEPPSFALQHEPLPKAPPRGINAVRGWQPGPASSAGGKWDQAYDWILRNGIRAGWAHMDRAPDELDRLARGLVGSGMNLFWGAGFPQLLLSPRGSSEARAKLLASWEKLAGALSGSSVRWFVGMEYPGRYASLEDAPRAVGAEGRQWDVPSPWDRETWRREVVRPAQVAAQWARAHPEVGGIVVDLEMYNRRPLFFSQGVDFGDAPFRAFLEARDEGAAEEAWNLPPQARFSWLRDQGFLADYEVFLERQAERMGRELREAVRAVHPGLILGSYSAGILHRWFYRGLWRGMGEPARPLLLFTFQRDVDVDLAELAARGVHILHVRALLMGMMKREDYAPLFQDALSSHWGYWLVRLTSLVASSGFYPIELPLDMSPEEAWQTILEANEKTAFRPQELRR